MVRRNRNTCSMLLRQMIIQGFNTGHMVWMEVRKNNLAHDSSLRDQIIDAGREGNLFVFIRRTGIDYQDNFTALPFRIGITRANPLAALQLRIFRYFRMLLCRTGSEKKPRVKTTGRKGRSHPAPNEGEVIGVEMQSVKVE